MSDAQHQGIADAAQQRRRFLPDAQATRAAGQALARALLQHPAARPLLITLQGELGAGKTTFVAGLLGELGHDGPVRSPTYTLIEPYELHGRWFHHLDLYRLTDPLQLEELGVRDLLLPGAVLLVEWPERAGSLLSKPDLHIELGYPEQGTEGRQLTLLAGDSLWPLLHSLTF